MSQLRSPEAEKPSTSILDGAGARANKNSNATYIHTLSKKVTIASKVHKSGAEKQIMGPPVLKGKITQVIPGRGKVQAGGVSGTISPKSGRVLLAGTAKKNGMEEEEEDVDDVDSDEYNQNMSEDEDGDF
jgi:hypothetical protein